MKETGLLFPHSPIRRLMEEEGHSPKEGTPPVRVKGELRLAGFPATGSVGHIMPEILMSLLLPGAQSPPTVTSLAETKPV